MVSYLFAKIQSIETRFALKHAVEKLHLCKFSS
jgi:hypothetical protein